MMKKMIVILFAIAMVSVSAPSMAAMSNSKVKKTTRFLTDKMGYELNLDNAQYDDAYEINFDFIYNVRYLMDDVLRGYDWALDDYYRFLDVRNDDLRWVLNSRQYREFLSKEYFYRPIYASGNSWNFRIYINYTNHNHFYFGKPRHYNTYCGGHYRTHFNNTSYYSDRYHHDHYNGHFSTKRENVYHSIRKSDFGIASSRPGIRPSSSSSSSSTSRPGNSVTTRPSRPSRPSSSHDDMYETGSSRPSNTISRPSNTVTRPSSTTTRPTVNESTVTQPSSSGSSRPSGGVTTAPVQRPSSRPSGSNTATEKKETPTRRPATPSSGSSDRTTTTEKKETTTRPSSSNSSSRRSSTSESSSGSNSDSSSSNNRSSGGNSRR